MQALVTDTHIHSSVWGLRGLGRAGVRTLAMAPRRRAAGPWSSYAAGHAIGPDVCADPAGFVEAVLAAVLRHGPLVVYPGQEESIDALLRADALPEQLVLPYPDAAALGAVRDKAALHDIADAAGVVVPATLYSGPVAGLDAGLVDGPAVLKAQRKGTPLGVARVVERPEQAEALLEQLDPGEAVLLQERLGGELAAVALVIDRDGGLVGRFQQRTLRTWPAEAGPSAMAVGIEPDEELAERLAGALAARGYWGLAQIQYLTGPSGPALIDINPRFYGTLSLAIASGVNLPALWHGVVCGEPSRPVAAYRTGVVYRHLEYDLMAALHGVRGVLLRRAPRPRVGAKWAADDPVAAALLSASASGAWVARQTRRLDSRGG